MKGSKGGFLLYYIKEIWDSDIDIYQYGIMKKGSRYIIAIVSEFKDAKIIVNALNKQIPLKPVKNFYNENCGEEDYDEGYVYSCPTCQTDHEVGRYSNELWDWLWQEDYCQKCGQRIKWD